MLTATHARENRGTEARGSIKTTRRCVDLLAALRPFKHPFKTCNKL